MNFSRWLLGVFFIVAGFNHFRSPVTYLPLMPPNLPFPLALVHLSGLFEILGGLGILIPQTRRAAGWGLLALLVAVFPANIYAALNGLKIGEWNVPNWMLWARLPLQPLLMWWVWRETNSPKNKFAE